MEARIRIPASFGRRSTMLDIGLCIKHWHLLVEVIAYLIMDKIPSIIHLVDHWIVFCAQVYIYVPGFGGRMLKNIPWARFRCFSFPSFAKHGQKYLLSLIVVLFYVSQASLQDSNEGEVLQAR